MNYDPFSLLDRSYRDSYTSNESDYHFFNDSENDHINNIKDYRFIQEDDYYYYNKLIILFENMNIDLLQIKIMISKMELKYEQNNEIYNNKRYNKLLSIKLELKYKIALIFKKIINLYLKIKKNKDKYVILLEKLSKKKKYLKKSLYTSYYNSNLSKWVWKINKNI